MVPMPTRALMSRDEGDRRRSRVLILDERYLDERASLVK
jgi:hypothetical protein